MEIGEPKTFKIQVTGCASESQQFGKAWPKGRQSHAARMGYRRVRIPGNLIHSTSSLTIVHYNDKQDRLVQLNSFLRHYVLGCTLRGLSGPSKMR